MKKRIIHIIPILIASILIFQNFLKADSDKPASTEKKAESLSDAEKKADRSDEDSDINDAEKESEDPDQPSDDKEDDSKEPEEKTIIEEKTPDKDTDKSIEEKTEKDKKEEPVIEDDKEKKEKIRDADDLEKEEDEEIKKEDKEKTEEEDDEIIDEIIKDDKKKEEPEKKELKKAKKEYIGLHAGYGAYIPISAYGNRYEASHHFGLTASVYYVNLWGISPELHFRYSDMKSKSDPLRFDSSISLVQIFPGLVYRHEIGLPSPLKKLTVYARIWDGLTRVSYESANLYYPFMKREITEYINIFGLSVGSTYPVYMGLLAGIDFSYSLIATAGSPLQSFSVMLNVGYRIW